MTLWINATGVAALFTTLFALRCSKWRSPRVLVVYFWAVFFAEFSLAKWLLPPDIFGSELGILCLVLSGVVSAAIYAVNRYEHSISRDR